MECRALEEVIFCGTAEQWDAIQHTEPLSNVPRSYHAWQEATCGEYPSCEYCDAVSEDMIPHTPGDEPTETTGQYCTVCGQELTPALGTPTTQPSQGTSQPDNDTTLPSSSANSSTTPSGDKGDVEPRVPVVVWVVVGVAALGGVGAAVWFLILRKRI